MLVGHVLMFFILRLDGDDRLILPWAVRIGQFGLMAWVFFDFRRRPRAALSPGSGLWGRLNEDFWAYLQSLLPTKAAERQLWAIWAGYLLGYVIIVAIM